MAGKAPPHVLIFPVPYQGPMNSMFKLAEIICYRDIHVTFLVTEFIHRRLLSSSNLQIQSLGRNFELREISDGLPDDHPRSGNRLAEVLDSLKQNTRPLLKSMMTSGEGIFRQPVTCIIADGIMGWTFDLAQEIGIPIFYCRTLSPCSLWTFFCLPGIIESGELPPIDGSDTSSGDMDKLVTSVPGTEHFLRRRDLPRLNHLGDGAYDVLQVLKQESQENRRARGLILNTFEELDGIALSGLRKTCPNIYAIGPIHAHVKTGTGSTSFWDQDRSCLDWLDRQSAKSVLYVSFGSITTFSKSNLMELWYGLVNSGVNFLWVMRPDFIIGENWEKDIPAELSAGTKQRGCIVGWAPQSEVLEHSAVGGFLTHSGWNSTLESISSGVPMICWPYFVDQQVNSRFVSAAWRLGLDMKDTCDRAIVEEMVRELMVVRKEEFCRRADEMAELCKKCLMEGGSSFCHLQRLVDDIRSMA